MTDILIISLFVLMGGVLLLQLALFRKPQPVTPDFSDVRSKLEVILQSIQQTDHGTRDEFSRLRQEVGGQQQAFKLEVANSLSTARSATAEQIQQFRSAMDQRLDNFGQETNLKIDRLRQGVTDSGSLLQAHVGQELERVR